MTAILYRGRPIKVIDRARHRVLGIFRALPAGGGRLVPVDKKNLGRELAIPQGATLGAEDGDLVAAEISRSARLGLPTAQVKERLGSLASEKAVNLIAIHAHGLPHEFSREALREADEARQAGLDEVGKGGRTGATWPSSPSTRSTPRITTTPCSPGPTPIRRNPGGFIIDVAIADVAALCHARIGARPRGAGARQFGVFPRPRGPDAAGAHLQ